MTSPTDHYREVSSRYDELWSYSEDYLRTMTALLARHLDLDPEHRFADVGGGTGLYARRLQHHVGLKPPVIVSDPCAEMLTSVQGLEAIDARCETADDFALHGPTVDRILLKEVVHHFSELDATIGALADRLALHGRMLVAMLPPTIDYPLFDAALQLYQDRQPHYDTVCAAMLRAGLDVDVNRITIEIHIERDRYLGMVASRYMSLLSAFDDYQLDSGIREMHERMPDPQLVIPDNFVLVSGTRIA